MLTFALALKLLVAAPPPTQLVIEIKPAGVMVKLDGKKLGPATDKPFVRKVKPGSHTIRLEHRGDTHEEEVVVKAGEKKTFVLSLEDAGRRPDPVPAPEPAPATE
jgi:hypothetical protein